MIALLTGKLLSKQTDRCVIDVQGVGYEVIASLQTISRLPETGTPFTLHIYTYIREAQMTLYGFNDLSEKEIFRKLIAISGIGPRMAISLLSGVPVPDLITSICGEDVARLSTIPGIGKKTAERIVIELKDKLVSLLPLSTTGLSRKNISPFEEACSALINLGYSKPTAEMALHKIEERDNMALPEILKQALKELARS